MAGRLTFRAAGWQAIWPAGWGITALIRRRRNAVRSGGVRLAAAIESGRVLQLHGALPRDRSSQPLAASCRKRQHDGMLAIQLLTLAVAGLTLVLTGVQAHRSVRRLERQVAYDSHLQSLGRLPQLIAQSGKLFEQGRDFSGSQSEAWVANSEQAQQHNRTRLVAGARTVSAGDELGISITLAIRNPSRRRRDLFEERYARLVDCMRVDLGLRKMPPFDPSAAYDQAIEMLDEA